MKKQSMNKFLISEEAYFGADNQFVSSVKSYITEIRTILDRTKDIKKDSFIKELTQIGDNIGKLIASNVNAESCSISLFKEANAFCIPMCWDDYKTMKKEKIDVSDHISSLEDIVETSNGYRFKTPNRKKLILCLGLGLFDIMNDDEITAILFHEIGHAFQHMLVGINGNITWVRLQHAIKSNSTLLNTFILLVSFGVSIFGMDFKTVNKGKKDTLNNTNVDHGDRDSFAKELQDVQKTELKNEYDDLSSDRKKGHNVFEKLFRPIIGVFTGFSKLIIAILFPLFKAVNVFSGLYELANLKWIKKNRMFEQFADHFATVYGLGPHLASALKKFGAPQVGPELDSLNFLNYVPLLNLWLAWSHHLSDSSSSLKQGYPDTKGRHAVIYKTLVYELQNNKDLTDSQKKEISEQMDGIEKVYQDYINTTGPKGVIFRIMHRVVEKSIADVKSDVEENVLNVLNEKQKDIKDISKTKELTHQMNLFDDDPIAAINNIKNKDLF